MCVCILPSIIFIHVAVCGPIGTKFGKHMQIHLEKVVGKIKICHVSPREEFGGVLGGQKSKILEKLPKGWTKCHQISHTFSDSSGNGHRLKTISPSIPHGGILGGFRGSQNSKVWKIYQTVVPRDRGSFWGLGGQNVIQCLRNAMICREKMKINYIKMKCTNRHNYAATIPGEAG